MKYSLGWPVALLAGGFALNTFSADKEILSTIHLHPALEISLFAKEPDVVDPVALTFDEAGRMYVVEMRDYPYGQGPDRKPMGTIRLLEDRNGNGRLDRSTLFAKDLSFPTSIAPYKGGVLVTAPPQIIYLKDTDNDGVADLREVFFDGFVLGVTDSNVNGLRWGIDGRVHGLNGGNAGAINSPRNRAVNVPINDADFSFDPATLDFTRTFQTSAGFGLAFDDWGRSFVTYNIDHIQHRHIPFRFLQRHKSMLAVAATASISDHEVMSRIFPISKPVTRENHPEQSGHFSSAGGVGILGDTRWPYEFYGHVLIGDVVGNLVHRDVIRVAGASFRATRAFDEQDREFMASTDPAARFVAFETGPDGALYIADMQRDVIEHPDYIPEKIKQKANLRAGDDRGRIFRVVPKEGKERFARVTIDRKDATGLVIQLQSPNPWVRLTAHRLLVEEKHESAISDLRTLLSATKSVQAYCHGLNVLQSMGALKNEDVLSALRKQDPEIRENAMLLLEKLFPPGKGEPLPPEIEKQVVAQKNATERLRFISALVLGDYPGPVSRNTLFDIWTRNQKSKWIRMAVLSSLGPDASQLLIHTLVSPVAGGKEPEADAIRELADVAAASGGNLQPKIAAIREASAPIKNAVIEGLNSGLSRSGSNAEPDREVASLLEQLAQNASPELFANIWELSRTLKLKETSAQKAALAKSLKDAADPNLAEEKRIAAIQLLRFSSFENSSTTLEKGLQNHAASPLQKSILQTLRGYKHDQAGKLIVRNWPLFAPALRTDLINFLLSRKPYHEALVTAIENKEIALGELNLDLEQRRALLRDSTPDIQARAAKFIGDEEYSNRKETVTAWLEKLPAEGDPAKGREIFLQACAKCHKAGELGIAVGPDLNSVSHRSVEDLLSNILDPNMAINPNYINYNVLLADGETETGILQSESGVSITLLQAEGKQLTLPRNKIKQIKSSSVSLMPEGIEATLQPADLRNLIAWLQQKK